LVFLVLSLTSATLYRKTLAGLPENFASHRIPEPVLKLEQSAYLNIHLQDGEESMLTPGYRKIFYNMDIPVDAKAPLQLTLASPIEDKLSIILTTPSGQSVPLSKYHIKESFPVGDSGLSVPVSTYFINDIQETGFYSLTVESLDFINPVEREAIIQSQNPNCVLIIFNYDNIEIETSLNSYQMKVGHNVGLYAQILKEGKNARQLLELGDTVVVSKADMMVETPSGSEMDVPMHDDGLFGDKVRGDHIYSATVPTTAPGTYRLSAVLTGYITDANGNQRPFLKTAEHTFVVSPRSVEVNGQAWLSHLDSDRVNINVAVNMDKGVKTANLGNFMAYTEVYGTAADGSLKPAAWLGGVVNVQSDKSPFVTLQLNLRWLAHANVKGPLTLKNTFLADGDTQYPVTSFENSIHVKNSDIQHSLLYRTVLSEIGPLTVTDEMKFGVNPLQKSVNVTGAPTLFLLHGYCSDVNPFAKNSAFFKDAAFFLQSKANVNNDKFATAVHAYAQSLGSSLYSLIGHSQGGTASLHLLNAYWSGLDHISSGRRIQSVGTPWKGNSAAGSSANLGKMFGIGCGPNNDLTLDGSANWFRGIHEDHTRYVYYYTTTYKQGNLFGDYCNMAINALLQWPNDGVSELKYSSLKGGNNLGNNEKWCHTTGMKYNAQYLDNTRNADMNAKAGRH